MDDFRAIAYPLKPNLIGSSWDNLINYKNNWAYTNDKLTQLNTHINQKLTTLDVAVAVAGSYGRMEASTESDLDFFILYNESTNPKEDTQEANIPLEVRAQIIEAAKSLAIELPNIDGVFSEGFSVQQILNNVGHQSDTLPKLAQRMLLLMESKPIYNKELYTKIVESILDKYLELIVRDPHKEAIFLLNDLIRYFRSIAVNYQYNFWKQNEKWVIRNVKLRHSRILMYAGLLLLILNASKKKDKISYLKEHVHLTPIEKVVSVYQDNGDKSFERLLGAYDVFLGKMNKKNIREELQADYNERYVNEHYAQLKATSDLFSSELTRFIYAQRGNWSQEIFEYLIF